VKTILSSLLNFLLFFAKRIADRRKENFKRMRTHFRNLFVGFVSFCLVVAVLDLLVDNPYTQKLFSAYLNRIVAEETNLSLNVESLSFNIIPLEIQLYGVQAHPISERDKMASASAIEVRLRLSLRSLFLRESKIAIVHIDGLNVRVPAHFHDPLFKNKATPSKHPTPWPLQSLSLENSQVLFDLSEEGKPPTRVSLSGLNTTLNFKDAHQFKGQVFIGALNFANKGKEYFRGTEISSEIVLAKENLSLTNLRIQDPYFKVQSEWSGSLSLKDHKKQYLRLNGRANIDANLKMLDRILDWKKTRGRAQVHSKILLNIPFSNMAEMSFLAEGSLEAQDGYLSDIRIYDSKSLFTVDNNGIKFKNTRIVIDKKEYARLEGGISFNDKVDFDFKGQVKDFALSQILSSFGAKLDAIDFKTYSDTLEFGGTGDPYKMYLRGIAELDSLDFPPLKIPRNRYTRTPNCYANLNLLFTTQRLEFNDSNTLCFLPPEGYTPKAPQKKNFAAPPAALFTSILQLREYIDFDHGPHFSILAKDLDLALTQSYLQVDITGKTNLTTKIYEQNHTLSITNKFSTRSLNFEKIHYGDVDGTLNVLDHSLEWKDVTSHEGTFQILSKKGIYDWKEDIVSFFLTAQNVPKDIVKKTLSLTKHEGISQIGFGVHNLDGFFKIPLTKLHDTELDFSIQTTDVDYLGEPVFRDLGFSNKTKSSLFQFPNIHAHFGDLAWKGALSYKKTDYNTLFDDDDEIDADLNSDSEKRTSVDFKSLPFIAKYFESLSLAGKVDFHAKLKGALRNLGGYVDLTLNESSAHGYPTYPLSFKGFVNHSQFQIFASQPGDSLLGRLDIDGSKKDIPFKWFLNLKQFDLRPFAPKIFQKDARNYAYLTAQWSLEGQFKQWWGAKGYLKLDNLKMSYAPESDINSEPLYLSSQKPARILMSPKGWSFENKQTFKISGLDIDIELLLHDSKPPRNLGFYIDSSFGLANLPRFSPLFQSGTGTVYMESGFDGPVENLRVYSHLFTKPSLSKEDENSLAISDLNPPFQDLQLDVLYKNNIFYIQDISAHKGKGTIKIDGTFDTSELKQDSNVHINMNQFTLDLNLPYLKTLHTVLNGHVNITGRERPYKFDGNIKITRAQTSKFLDLEGEILKEYSTHRISSNFQEAKKPMFEFNLDIEANKSFEIKSRSLTSTFSSSVTLKGTSEKPILRGYVNVDKGRFRYKREFIITHGEMIFNNPLRNDPKLNIVAKSQVGNYTVTIFISGDSSKPLVDILVDPAIKEDGSAISRLDAIVLLSTGRLPLTETRSQDTSGVVVSTGLNLYAAQLPFDKFNELTGQKFITPYVNYTTDDKGSPVPQLNVPLHISDLVEAIIQTIPNRTSATVQVPLHDNISLSGSASSIQRTTDSAQETNQTQSGFDLKFTFPFK
jgi:hypothetical protein